MANVKTYTLTLDAQKLICMNARLMRVVKRMQETEAKA